MPQKIFLDFRRMHLDDIAAVHRLEKETYEFPWGETAFVNCLQAGYDCWLLCQDDGVIGYSMMVSGALECHLLNICVVPSRRRQGYGREFLRFMIGEAAVCGARRMFLEVSSNNPAALQLYHSEHFKQIGVRRNYYPAKAGREDALVMARPIWNR